MGESELRPLVESQPTLKRAQGRILTSGATAILTANNGAIYIRVPVLLLSCKKCRDLTMSA